MERLEKPMEKSCCSSNKPQEKSIVTLPNNAQGKYYCPMHCEGEKVYDKPGDCPVCGMNLEKVPELSAAKIMYTCPMHPEVIKEGPGSCPICGMDLVPMEPTDTEENKVYDDLVRKMKISVVFTVPVFAIAMLRNDSNNPLMTTNGCCKMELGTTNFIASGSFLCVLDVFCSCLEIHHYLESQYVYPYRNWYRSGIYI